jgi:pyrroline-5-carboxylate reductase
MSETRLAIIGAGNIAHAIVTGLLESGLSTERIVVSDTSSQQLAPFAELGISVTSDNCTAVADTQATILCVKPDVVPLVAREICASVAANDSLVISVAAGVGLQSLALWLGENIPLVRCMPNTPALVQLGATGMYANNLVTTDQKSLATRIMGSVGLTIWLDAEDQLNAVTALSGSGPAYFFYVMEIMAAVGTGMGLSTEVCRQLVLQTALGASTMAARSAEEPAELRRRVTSPGGTTAAALECLREHGLPDAFRLALEAAQARSVELSQKAAAT